MKSRLPVLLLAIAGILCPSVLDAQVYSVNFSEKVIRTDELNMPGNTSIYTILTMLPDMLQRSGTDFLSNYDLSIDGMSMPDLSGIALQHLQIIDVEKIEISDSSVGNYMNKGQAGSINIVLRGRDKEAKKVWGNAGITANDPLNINPQVLAGYRTDKLQVKGIILGEIGDGTSDSVTDTYSGDTFLSTSLTSVGTRKQAELARAYLTWQPTGKDKFQMNVSESFSHGEDITTTDHDSDGRSVDNSKNLNVQTHMKYTHDFGRSSLTASMQYVYAPGNVGRDYPLKLIYEDGYSSNTIAGNAEWEASLLPSSSKHHLKLTTGCNFNFSGCNNVLYSKAFSPAVSEVNDNFTNSSHFVQPYAALQAELGKFRFKLSAEYQYYHYGISRKEGDYSTPSHDFTGTFIAEWHPDQHNKLRLILNRSLSRPTEAQLFPLRVYDLENRKYVIGNPELKPAFYHEARLDYLSDYKWNDHSLILDMSVGYYSIRRIITPVEAGGNKGGKGSFGMTLKYLTYDNSGTADIVNANFMALYRYKVVTVSFTGNIYHDRYTYSESADHYTYCNLALNSCFNLQAGWMGGAKIVYNSRIARENGRLGGSSHTTLMIGKRWGGLFVNIFERVSLQKNSIDITYLDGGGRTETSYDPVPNITGIGLNFAF